MGWDRNDALRPAVAAVSSTRCNACPARTWSRTVSPAVASTATSGSCSNERSMWSRLWSCRCVTAQRQRLPPRAADRPPPAARRRRGSSARLSTREAPPGRRDRSPAGGRRDAAARRAHPTRGSSSSTSRPPSAARPGPWPTGPARSRPAVGTAAGWWPCGSIAAASLCSSGPATAPPDPDTGEEVGPGDVGQQVHHGAAAAVGSASHRLNNAAPQDNRASRESGSATARTRSRSRWTSMWFGPATNRQGWVLCTDGALVAARSAVSITGGMVAWMVVMVSLQGFRLRPGARGSVTTPPSASNARTPSGTTVTVIACLSIVYLQPHHRQPRAGVPEGSSATDGESPTSDLPRSSAPARPRPTQTFVDPPQKLIVQPLATGVKKTRCVHIRLSTSTPYGCTSLLRLPRSMFRNTVGESVRRHTAPRPSVRPDFADSAVSQRQALILIRGIDHVWGTGSDNPRREWLFGLGERKP